MALFRILAFALMLYLPQAQSAEGTPGFALNFGLTGSWYNPQTPGQGFLFDVVVGQEPQQLVVYWFTFDTEAGGPEGQRWYVAQGEFEDGAESATLNVFMSTGGVFDAPDPVSLDMIGQAELEFSRCTEATFSYDIDLDGDPARNVSGVIPLERLSPDVLCADLGSAGLAFPGCQGWGCDSPGGRGEAIYTVTSLADSGPGTLREALEATEPRTIIAGTDGVIRLESPVQAGGGDVTVNFLRPPGGGITLTGHAVMFDSMTDVVLLGLRYRGTDSIDEHNDQNPVDCITLTSVKRAVAAHSSFYGCVDEAVSIERSRQGAAHLNEDITIQLNLFWEGCMIDCQEGQGHARPVNVSRGWDRVAIHHNVMAGNQQRSPQLAGCVGHPGCLDEWPLEPTGFVGYNLIAHWLSWATHVKNGARVDIVGNLYIPGPEATRVAIDIPDNEDLGTLLHLSGNQECASWGVETCGPASSSTGTGALADNPLAGLSITATPPDTLRSQGWLRSLGPSDWDAEDERALGQLVDGSMRVGGDYDPNTYQPPAPVPAPRLPDRDGDGIPDLFDPQPEAFSAWEDSNGDGWSDLEAYLFRLPML